MEQLFRQPGGRSIVPSLSGKGVNDSRLSELASFLARSLLRSFRRDLGGRPSVVLVLHELNLSDNRIGNVGVQALVEALLSECIELRILKLHKNRVSTAGAQAIANFIENVAKPPWEVHLSHNALGPSSARRLFVAAASRREYPLAGTIPLWLRLEWQRNVSDWIGFESCEWKRWDLMAEMVAYAEAKLYCLRQEQGYVTSTNGYLICQKLGTQCCCNASICGFARADGTGPILHLPYVWQQGREPKGTYVSDQGRDGGVVRPAVPFSGRVAEGPLPVDSYVASSCRNVRFTPSVRKQEPTVVYETPRLMVLNKGPYWLCTFDNRKSKKYVPDSLRDKSMCYDRRSWQDIVNSNKMEHFDLYLSRRFHDEMAWSLALEGAGCIHRLDKNTSGCILRAKTQIAFDQLTRDLHAHKITKLYLCLAHGKAPLGQETVIEDKIGIDRFRNEAFIDDYWGDWAVTRVRCVAHLKDAADKWYSLCKVEILSGRTHQIRVHMMHRGLPLVTDPKYNPMLVCKDEQWCPRIFLHASSMVLLNECEQCPIVAPLAVDLRGALSKLRLMALAPDCSAGELYHMTGVPFASDVATPIPTDADVPSNAPALTFGGSEEAFSPRALQAITLSVDKFAQNNNVTADNRFTFTLDHLRRCGLVSSMALSEAPLEQWPKRFPEGLIDMIKGKALVRNSSFVGISDPRRWRTKKNR